MTPDSGKPSMKFYDKNMNEITHQKKLAEWLYAEYQPKRDPEMHYGGHVHWAHNSEGAPFREKILGEWKEADADQ